MVHEVTYAESHGHLPPKRRVMLRIPIEQQRAEVTGYARELNKTADEERKTFLRLALASSRKRSYAAATLPDYLKAGKGKMIIFTGLKKDADAWAEAFGKVEIRGTPLQTWASHGDASASERDEVLQAYMAHPGPCVLCVTWQAWGVALNLDDTDVIVFAMLPFRPRDIAQAEGRGDRASMTRSLLYIYLIAEGTADEWVIDLILGKLEAVRAVSPGTRLDAFGGMRSLLIGLDQADELQKRMLARLEADIYADAD
jgi:superfamily II DNA/RNA helicase